MRGSSCDLLALLLDALGRPPSKVGLRLKPEEELARLLGVGRRRVRNLLDALEQQGYLARRRGSGTYVRRVPEAGLRMGPGASDGEWQMAPEAFFVDGSDQKKHWLPTPGPIPAQQVLHLELWKDLHSSPTVGQAIVDGIIMQASELSHHLTIHSFFARKSTLLTVEELRQRLQASPCDGFIVASRWSDLFMEAAGGTTTPRIYYSSSKREISHEPHLMLDTAEAVGRGVGILAGAGHSRIGVLTIAAAGHVGQLDLDAYERAMISAKLSYRAAASAERDVNVSIEATLELLNRDDPPDALYVSDNFLLDGVVAALRMKNRIPGRDIAIITHGNVEHELPSGFDWSRIEFDLHDFGRRLVNELLRGIQHADFQSTSLAVLGRWQSGTTHELRNA